MIRAMFVSFWVNLFLTIGKVVVGFFGNSSVLVADGVSSFSDLITDIFAIIGGVLSKKSADKTHPFGYGKLEYVFSLFISLIIISLGVFVILHNSYNEVIYPKYFVLIFVVIAVVVKILLVKFLYDKSKLLNSDILLYSSLESKLDVYGTIIVFFTSICMLLSKYIDFLKYTNLISTIVIGILILVGGIRIFIYNVKELSIKKFSGDLNKEVRDIILAHKEIESINKMYIFKYGEYYQLFAEFIFVDDIKLSKAHDIVENIKHQLYVKKIRHIYIEMDS